MYFLVKRHPFEDINPVPALFLHFFSLFFRHFTDFDLKNRKRHVIFALGPYSHALTPYPAYARIAGEKDFGT